MRKKDVLEKKEAKLVALNERSDAAIRLVQATVTGLEAVNGEIEATMAEINDYQKRLAETYEGLDATRNKNQRIMQNFKNLLCIE